MKKIDWIIHLVASGVSCSVCGETENGFLPNMCDAHTHGLDKYGHQEFQMVLMIDPEMICYILNTLGLRVQAGEKFKDGDSVSEIIKDYDIRLKEVVSDGKSYCGWLYRMRKTDFLTMRNVPSIITSSTCRCICFILITKGGR